MRFLLAYFPINLTENSEKQHNNSKMCTNLKTVYMHNYNLVTSTSLQWFFLDLKKVLINFNLNKYDLIMTWQVCLFKAIVTNEPWCGIAHKIYKQGIMQMLKEHVVSMLLLEKAVVA